MLGPLCGESGGGRESPAALCMVEGHTKAETFRGTKLPISIVDTKCLEPLQLYCPMLKHKLHDTAEF